MRVVSESCKTSYVPFESSEMTSTLSLCLLLDSEHAGQLLHTATVAIAFITSGFIDHTMRLLLMCILGSLHRYWQHAPKTCKNFAELVSNLCLVFPLLTARARMAIGHDLLGILNPSAIFQTRVLIPVHARKRSLSACVLSFRWASRQLVIRVEICMFSSQHMQNTIFHA